MGKTAKNRKVSEISEKNYGRQNFLVTRYALFHVEYDVRCLMKCLFSGTFLRTSKSFFWRAFVVLGWVHSLCAEVLDFPPTFSTCATQFSTLLCCYTFTYKTIWPFPQRESFTPAFTFKKITVKILYRYLFTIDLK